LREGNPLLETRRDQATNLARLLEDNDLLVLTIAARTGNSSLMRLMPDAVRNQGEGWGVVFLPSRDVTRRTELEDALDVFSEEHPGCKPIIIVDEANGLAIEPSHETPFSQDGYKALLELLKDGAKVVLMAHDAIDEQGRYVAQRHMEKLGQGAKNEGLRVSTVAIECPNTHDLSEMFEIYAKEMRFSERLRARKQELLELCTVPEQMAFVFQYCEHNCASDSIDKMLDDAIRELILVDTPHVMELSITPTGGEIVWGLIKKIGEGIDASVLSPKERGVIQHYLPYHIFETSEGGRITVRGSALRSYAQTRKTPDQVGPLPETEEGQRDVISNATT